MNHTDAATSNGRRCIGKLALEEIQNSGSLQVSLVRSDISLQRGSRSKITAASMHELMLKRNSPSKQKILHELTSTLRVRC